jgi:hypothetical protein
VAKYSIDDDEEFNKLEGKKRYRMMWNASRIFNTHLMT